MNRALYSRIASALQAMSNCAASGNTEWYTRHEWRISQLVKEFMPSGAGLDSGTKFDEFKSNAKRLVFDTAFHHMNEHGFYDGWTYHSVIVTPSLVSRFDIRVTGRNRNDIKDYIAEVFHAALSQEISDDIVVKLDAA